MPRLCEFYPGICLTTEEKARKNLSQGKKNLSQGKKNLSQGKKNLSQGKKNFSQGKKNLSHGKKNLSQGKKNLSQGKKNLSQRPATPDHRSNYENNQQGALYRLIYYSKSVLHVSGDVFGPSSGALDCFYSIWWCSAKMLPAGVSNELKLVRDTSRQQLG